MDNVMTDPTAAPRRTLIAAGRLPKRDAALARATRIERGTLPLAADIALAQLYTVVSRCVRMVDAHQADADVALLFIAAALETFDTAAEDAAA